MKWILICLLFLSCTAGNGNKSQVTEECALDTTSQEEKSEKANISLELSQTHFAASPQTVTLTITNNSQWNCIAGYEYFIEKEKEKEKEKEDWERIPLKNAAFIEVGLGIRPNSTRDLQIDLSNVCQKYTKGTYRVGKEIRIENIDGYRDTTCYCLFKVL